MKRRPASKILNLKKPLNEYSQNNIMYQTLNNFNKNNFGITPEIDLSFTLSTGQSFNIFGNPGENLQSIINKGLKNNNLLKYENKISFILSDSRKLELNKTLSENEIKKNCTILLIIKDLEDKDKNPNSEKSLQNSYSTMTLHTENPIKKFKKNLLGKEKTSICNGINECIHIHTNRHKHGLVLLYSNSNWNCKICNTNFLKNKATNFCSLCDFDLCNICIGKKNSKTLPKFYNEQTQLESYTFPCHEHKMIYCRISSTNKNMNKTCACNLCFRTYNYTIWSFYCTNCNYFICLSCSKQYIPADKFINISVKINTHIHRLAYMLTNSNWTCNLCQKFNNKLSPSYNCSNCNYDVCEECMKKFIYKSKFPLLLPGKKENQNINIINDACHNHPLIYCYTSRGSNGITNWVCNKCSKTYKNKWSFYCSMCNFDLCYDCYINSIQK